MIEPGNWRRLRYRCGQLASARPTMINGNRKLSVRSVIFDMRPLGYQMGPHLHAEYQLLLFLEAESSITDTAGRQPIERGYTVLLSPEVRHTWQILDSPCQIFAVFFSIDPAQGFPMREKWPVCPELADEVERFSEVLLQGNPKESPYASTQLMAVIYRAISLFNPEKPSPPKQGTRPIDLPEAIQQLVYNDPAHPWTLREIALHFGVSSRHLSRLFHADSGDTVIEHVMRCRLDYARALLREGDNKISDICARSGMTDQANFCRRFRRHFGMTPGEYRRLAQGLPGN